MAVAFRRLRLRQADSGRARPLRTASPGISSASSRNRGCFTLFARTAQFYGTFTINGSTATSSFIGVSAANSTFADGSSRGTGTLNATIQARTQLSVTATFTTQNSTTSNITMTVQYDASHDPDSSLATVAGNFTNISSPGADVFTINNGVVTSSDNTGCMANGTVTLIDGHYNL